MFAYIIMFAYYFYNYVYLLNNNKCYFLIKLLLLF